MLTGCSAAEALHAAVRAAPTAPLSAGVVGPGGTGKSALLAELRSTYQAAGVPVVAAGAPVAEVDASGGVAVLVDNAHELDRHDLERLLPLVGNPDIRLVVAYRPWPRQPALSALTSALFRSRPPVVLKHLDRAGITARAADLTGSAPSDKLVELLVGHTGGLPVLIDRVVAALQETGALDGSDPLMVPWHVTDHLRYDLDRLDEGTRAVLLALAVGATPDSNVLAPALEIEPPAVMSLLEDAQSTGLLLPTGTLIPLARQAVLAACTIERRRTVARRLLDIQLERGAAVLDLARALASSDCKDITVASVLQAAGDEALQESPALAGELFTEAVAAGAAPLELAARRAEAAALTGRLDVALQFADSAVAATTSPHVSRGTHVTASVLAHRGMLARSAELYQWLGSDHDGTAASLAVMTLIGTGALDDARDALAAAQATRAPTLLAGAETLMAQGVLESLTGSPSAALSMLTQAAAMLEPTGRGVLLPDTPAALAALVALHCGELDLADSVLTRAVSAQLGGTVAAPRHHLLLAWIAMLRGDADRATAQRNAALAVTNRLEPRDALFAAALEVGLARRATDIPALTESWPRAREAIIRHPVDLFVLLPLGELAVAAAQLREIDRLAPHLDTAQELLRRLGEPFLWGSPLHWSGVHAAILMNEPEALAPHARALVAAAKSSPYAAVLARAGRAWTDVLSDDIDPDRVIASARELQQVGLSWDGARLVSQAALRTPDRQVMMALLGVARSMQSAGFAGKAVSAGPLTPAAPDAGLVAKPLGTQAGVLSAREREVADLVLRGLTHRQVGEKLFISGKTVEHHMARMRQRLGAESRSALFAMLRAELDGDGRTAAG
jgi:DNA-binding CsgD family transcriptional regulator